MVSTTKGASWSEKACTTGPMNRARRTTATRDRDPRMYRWKNKKDTLTVDIENGRQPGPDDLWKPKAKKK